MGYNEIYYENEEKYIKLNQEYFKKFIFEFKKITGVDISNLLWREEIAEDDYCAQFYYLRYIVNLYYPEYLNVFYNLLIEFGYDISSEIIDTMKTLAKLPNGNLDHDVINYLLRNPYIDNIYSNNGLITVESNKLGEYTFYSVRKFLENNKEIIELINKYQTTNFCHQMSLAIIKYLNDARLITSLLPLYFEGTYYHTTIEFEDKVIDVANEIVLDKSIYLELFKDEHVVETKKEDIDRKIREAKEDVKEEQLNYPPALLLALHSESRRLG